MLLQLKTYIGPETEWEPKYVFQGADGALLTEVTKDGARIIMRDTLMETIIFAKRNGHCIWHRAPHRLFQSQGY